MGEPRSRLKLYSPSLNTTLKIFCFFSPSSFESRIRFAACESRPGGASFICVRWSVGHPERSRRVRTDTCPECTASSGTSGTGNIEHIPQGRFQPESQLEGGGASAYGKSMEL